MNVRYIVMMALLAGCATPDIRRVELVSPASFKKDAVFVCVYKRDARLLRCMTPEDAYLMLEPEPEDVLKK